MVSESNGYGVRLYLQGVHANPGVEHLELAETGVHGVLNAVDGERCLSDVCRNNDLNKRCTAVVLQWYSSGNAFSCAHHQLLPRKVQTAGQQADREKAREIEHSCDIAVTPLLHHQDTTLTLLCHHSDTTLTPL
jgi:hypothetical protein